MDVGIIFIIILLILAVIFIIYFYNIITKEKEPIDNPFDITPDTIVDTTTTTGWGPQEPVDGIKGQCGVYTFRPIPGTNNPGIPTMNNTVLDLMTPVPMSATGSNCIDTDQSYVKKVKRLCTGLGLTGNKCYDSRGQAYNQGEIQELYVSCSAERCNNSLANVALNFDPYDFRSNTNTPQTVCLKVDDTNNIIGSKCDISDYSQQFRVETQNEKGVIDGQTASKKSAYSRIFYRDTQQCVVPSTISGEYGSMITLGDCQPSKGFVWWLFPSTDVYGLDSANPNKGYLAPQQIVYYPNNGQPPPSGADLTAALRGGDLKSMTPSVTNDINRQECTTNYNKSVILTTLGTNRNSPSNGGDNYCWNSQNAQLLDFTLYDILTTRPTGPNGTNIPFS